MNSTKLNYERFPNSPILKHARGVWIYSTIHDPNTIKVLRNEPHSFVRDIIQYNQVAAPHHHFTQLFTYGGTLEMDDETKPISQSNLLYYDEFNRQNILTYSQASSDYQIVPCIDGRVDSSQLKALNQLSREGAKWFADLISTKLAGLPIPGVQFDIEPFDINQPGQANFYEAIAQRFHEDENFPFGRFFSVFTYSSRINSTLADILNRFQNGYIIDSLYDLNSSSQATSPAEYALLVDKEVKAMMEKARLLNIKYQFAIPASASTNEYEQMDNHPSTYSQIDFVKAALAAIEANDVRNDPNFIGINVWCFAHSIHFHHHHFHPTTPPQETLSLLATQL